jgi:hypothetical protein
VADLCYTTHPLAVRLDRPMGAPKPPPTRDVIEAARSRRKAQRLAKVNLNLPARVTSQGYQWGRAFVALQDRHEQQVAERLRRREDGDGVIARDPGRQRAARDGEQVSEQKLGPVEAPFVQMAERIEQAQRTAGAAEAAEVAAAKAKAEREAEQQKGRPV